MQELREGSGFLAYLEKMAKTIPNASMTRKLLKYLFASIAVFLFGSSVYAQDSVRFERFSHNPIITADLLPGNDGDDINGPALIKVPDWLPNKLGNYYLYFAHHKGKYIRLAYADSICGPWKIYRPGTLHISDCKICDYGLTSRGNGPKHPGTEREEDEVTHIASPDILIDSARKELALYFHCPIEDGGKYHGQYTLRAVSADGIHFKADSTVLGFSYFRVFKWRNAYYSISRAGLMARSKDGEMAFEQGPNPFSALQTKSSYLRHAAVRLSGDTLFVFYSRIGDAPERILMSRILLNDDWNTWRPSAPIDIAAPSEMYEANDLPALASATGSYYGRVRQLRDPFVYVENGKWWLLYSAAGESSIVMGQLYFIKKAH
jgi:hypothetical protein